VDRLGSRRAAVYPMPRRIELIFDQSGTLAIAELQEASPRTCTAKWGGPASPDAHPGLRKPRRHTVIT
jgi:hypothetical protein